MSQQLFLFQIGPVQTFIASARRTQDLFVGSSMLSQLAAAGVRKATESSDFEPIFPMFDPKDLDSLPKGVPHRFAFINNVEDVYEFARTIRWAIDHEWQSGFVQPVRMWLADIMGEGDWTEAYDRQTENWLEFNWVAVPYNPKSHKDSYSNAAILLAARRNSREIQVVYEQGKKCTLTGAQTQLPLNWKLLRAKIPKGDIELRENEALGAIAMIKRFAPHAGAIDGRSFRSVSYIASGINEGAMLSFEGKDTQSYFAVLHMDGDKMGVRISECETLQDHQEFSNTLAHFADTIVPDIIDQYKRAHLVYAGGDDVLALMPLNDVLPCANRIRTRFKELTDCSASAGIAITPYNLPLDTALDLARQAEHEAKENHGRDAVVITEAHGTGMIRSAGSRWEVNGVKITNIASYIQQAIRKESISSKLGYDLQEMTYDLVVDNTKVDKNLADTLKEARHLDVTRLLKRRIAKKLPEADKQKIIETLLQSMFILGDDKHCGWPALANWIIFARFLASAKEGESA